ncbi:TetR family transcriptional regulator [Kitasatospora acidiphila]|uniref:TetR family transcriptional regulator n=1 Tax=Kitasatospora acidiphila TaxID=2567942 RepID=A0A540WAS3_9ACTN|nr:TetR family transcriptional regulator [Kitasatospora acidiphila]TQF06140.1 TetR family transcriptional regulator [Kitasatospora acidiphila]
MTTDPAAGTPSGLRERKKQATRDALSWAALRLAVERGLENVRVEEIATAAGVSPRTFNNYFSSKYEAILFRHLDRTRQAAAALRERPADEPLWAAITEAVLAPYGPPDQEPGPEWTAGVRRMLAEPALQGEFARVAVTARAELARAIAERTGTDADRDLYPSLTASAVLTAQQAAGDQWLRCDPPVPITALLREALALLAAGLPDPSSSTLI